MLYPLNACVNRYDSLMVREEIDGNSNKLLIKIDCAKQVCDHNKFPKVKQAGTRAIPR